MNKKEQVKTLISMLFSKVLTENESPESIAALAEKEIDDIFPESKERYFRVTFSWLKKPVISPALQIKQGAQMMERGESDAILNTDDGKYLNAFELLQYLKKSNNYEKVMVTGIYELSKEDAMEWARRPEMPKIGGAK